MSHSELSEEGTSHLKIIREQLVGKMEVFSNLESEVVALCGIDEIKQEIEESEATTAKLIESKRKIDDGISTPSREVLLTPFLLRLQGIFPQHHDCPS